MTDYLELLLNQSFVDSISGSTDLYSLIGGRNGGRDIRWEQQSMMMDITFIIQYIYLVPQFIDLLGWISVWIIDIIHYHSLHRWSKVCEYRSCIRSTDFRLQCSRQFSLIVSG